MGDAFDEVTEESLNASYEAKGMPMEALSQGRASLERRYGMSLSNLEIMPLSAATATATLDACMQIKSYAGGAAQEQHMA